MTEERLESGVFGQVADSLLASGLEFRFQAQGRSMLPFIKDGEILRVKAIDPADVKLGDIVLFRDRSGFKAHRVIRRNKGKFATRGDAGLETDEAIRGEQIVGKITAKECGTSGRLIALEGTWAKM